MEQHSLKILSSLPMLKSSILTDSNVYRWFIFLADQRQVKEKLTQDQIFRKTYGKLRRGFALENVLHIFLIALLTSILLFKQYILIFFLLILIGVMVRLNSHLRQNIAQISEKLILDHVDDYKHKTLFQITEILGRIFKIPSLTDALSAVDNISRRVLIVIVMIFCFIIPFLNKEILVVLILFYITGVIILRSPLVLRCLKLKKPEQ